MEVSVHGKNLEGAIRAFRKKTQKDGIVKESRQRNNGFEKPSRRKKRKKEESHIRRRKLRKGETFY